MLPFIVRDRRTGRRYKVFQYISCYCLSNLLQIPCIIFFISIHLMLLFIRFCWIVWLTHPGISIHLMLLFIPITGFLDGINIEFQYISCYCLSSSILLSISLTHISIHLMLLFIMSGPRLKFQLNFISIHLMLLFIVLYSPLERRNKNFNTSHVTVYPSPSLSRITGRYFNTSHVTVYLVHVTLYLFWSVNFNTSHVTVYPFRIKISLCCFCISIHLMLLFI